MRSFVLALVASALALVGCGDDFAPKNAVRGVRILAARADQPYARPGESVRVQLLAHDGRTAPASPMRLFWFPVPCVDPIGVDSSFCYPAIEALFPLRTDLTPSLVEGKEATFAIPADALARAVVRPGQRERSATAYAFVAACAGHLERVARRSGLGQNALPVGCFDAAGRQLGAEDFVFGFTRIFVFDERRNAPPVLDGLVHEGKPIDPAVGIETGICVKDEQDECKTTKLDVRFPDSNAEIDPDNFDTEGNVGRETIYVDWFTSIGEFESDRKIVYDGKLGRPPKGTEIEFSPPALPGKGTVWAVLHDNRGGTNWIEFPLVIR